MSRVTSKLQLTLPKRLAEQYGIKPGDEIEFQAAGESIRLVPKGARAATLAISREEALRMLDEDVAWQEARQKQMTFTPSDGSTGRGWTREALYDRDPSD